MVSATDLSGQERPARRDNAIRPPRALAIEDIEALALGAWILGTGGGGSPYHKLLNMRELYRAGHTVSLIDPLRLDDDALVAVLSNMGAPLVGQERLADAAFAEKPLRTMERFLGRCFDAVMSLEIGGGNGVHPLMVVERRATEGFLRGQARIEGLGRDAGSRFTVHFQNEFSVGCRDGEPIVMTPDLICVVDSVSGEGIGTDVVRYGQRVSVLGLPGPAIFRTPKGLEHVGPRAFGFDLDYRSVFPEDRS